MLDMRAVSSDAHIMDDFLSGERLYGDDMTPAEIEAWYKDEADGYFDIAPRNKRYEYHARNRYHGFRFLPRRKLGRALGVGSAWGYEFAPIRERVEHITILDPGTGFRNAEFEYRTPNPSGLMPFEDAAFDLITCFGVLHHIPNVSTVIGEMHRVLKPGGYCLIEEPIVSMGDWRKPRVGLTKRERGIPKPIMHRMIQRAGFVILRERAYAFQPIFNLGTVIKTPFNHLATVILDDLICRFPWPYRYHAESNWQKFRPSSIFCVLTKA